MYVFITYKSETLLSNTDDWFYTLTVHFLPMGKYAASTDPHESFAPKGCKGVGESPHSPAVISHGQWGTPAGAQPGWPLTGDVFFHQVLQGQPDGVVLHGAGDEVRCGPRRRAVTLSRISLQGVGFVEMFHRRMDH